MTETWENIDNDVIVGPEIDMSEKFIPEEVRRIGIGMTASLMICTVNQKHPRYKENAAVLSAAPELLAKCEKIVAWLDRNAAVSEQESEKENRFLSLKDARLADAKNYRATADDIRTVIAKAKETEKADAL